MGHQSKYIKRCTQLDPLTVDNSNYTKSRAHFKYVYKGSRGYYSEKEMNPWHFNFNQTNMDRNYGSIRVVKNSDLQGIE